MSHPLTDALPDYLDALALRQACGEIEERVTRERGEARAQAGEANDERLNAEARWTEIIADELAENRRLMDLGGALQDENFTTFVERVIAERDALRAEVERLASAKDGAYEERNRCVALIARMAVAMGYRAGLARTAIEGWSEDWHGCVYIDLPTGQASWHYHDTHAHLFAGLPQYAAPWDGHDTPEKYRRVDSAREFTSVRSAWITEQLRQINDWCCYATEEDIAARLMALQQIGVLTRAALQEPTP